MHLHIVRQRLEPLAYLCFMLFTHGICRVAGPLKNIDGHQLKKAHRQGQSPLVEPCGGITVIPPTVAPVLDGNVIIRKAGTLAVDIADRATHGKQFSVSRKRKGKVCGIRVAVAALLRIPILLFQQRHKAKGGPKEDCRRQQNAQKDGFPPSAAQRAAQGFCLLRPHS